MKLNPETLRYLSREDIRILVALEIGSRMVEIVPVKTVARIANLRPGHTNKILTGFAETKLIQRMVDSENDGFRFGYGAADYLALNSFSQKGTAIALGPQIGVGKEADVYLVEEETKKLVVLKIYRLGRTSFRTVKKNRNYLKNNKESVFSWLCFSKLAAQYEFGFMALLHKNGFPVPAPIDYNRHCLVMEHIDGVLLNNVTELANPEQLYEKLILLLLRLASCGFVHCDFNEFNLIIKEHEETVEPVLIDFPQMISIDNSEAEDFFERDVECLVLFFHKRFSFFPEHIPSFKNDVIRTSFLDKETAPNNPRRNR